jgi:hypothetical protein
LLLFDQAKSKKNKNERKRQIKIQCNSNYALKKKVYAFISLMLLHPIKRTRYNKGWGM